MASEPSTSQPDGASVAPPDQLLVNLQVISPSVGVNHPLLFPGLPAATTIQQLKGKIRGNLPVLSPADEDQRLIYRGRALTRDTDTLQDIFGLEAVSSTLSAPLMTWMLTKALATASNQRTTKHAPCHQGWRRLENPHTLG